MGARSLFCFVLFLNLFSDFARAGHSLDRVIQGLFCYNTILFIFKVQILQKLGWREQKRKSNRKWKDNRKWKKATKKERGEWCCSTVQQGSWEKGFPSLTLFCSQWGSSWLNLSLLLGLSAGLRWTYLFRKPSMCSKELTHLQSFCKNVQVLAGGEVEAEVLLESFLCLLGCSLLLFPAICELRVDLLLLLPRSLKPYSQEAKVPSVKQLGSVWPSGNWPCVVKADSGVSGVDVIEHGWLVPEAGSFWIR